ncbi:L-aspartate oxidase [Clostridium cylindrosporum]|uniref:L-aspartate oxidase n=1 Tax=Clostridium cylindrosporum DSM 605 TaxID=1121307 RepID=A0A0J8D9E4_CLOCY|nr:L-aspartate oxidase [Clostridium cylindrosporum]KMT20913.1 L-aspartate oxidase NadB [Clostridium cylindrosporum DSM 605]
MDCLKYDVIIIGTGISGLFTALNIDKRKNILMLTKKALGSGSSELAQGGIVSCIDKDSHYKDTLIAGSYYNEKDAIITLQDESEDSINKLIELGVDFDKDESGNFLYTKEGGHSNARILHHKDATGKEIIRALTDKVRERKNIKVLENTSVIDILSKKEINAVISIGDSLKIFYAKSVVIATGGIGQVYKNTTNPLDITGDGIAIASRAGINICDMEFVQFHPTGMYSVDEERRTLISEAVRGEGAVLRNIKGERFMEKYHEMKELAPRDIVSISIFKELIETNSDYIFLDVTHLDKDFIKNRFPNIYEKCLSLGIDISKDYVKVSPTQHYLMGGIETNLNGRTNLNGIFACGECARTGVHGANRLASNSLLEGIVFANRISREINSISFSEASISKEDLEKDLKLYKGKFNNFNCILDLDDIKDNIKEIMEKYVGVIKNDENLTRSLDTINKIKQSLENNLKLSKDYFEVINIVTVSKLIIEGAIKRKENIGAHFKADLRRDCIVR